MNIPILSPLNMNRDANLYSGYLQLDNITEYQSQTWVMGILKFCYNTIYQSRNDKLNELLLLLNKGTNDIKKNIDRMSCKSLRHLLPCG